jgi:hypothetical protein
MVGRLGIAAATVVAAPPEGQDEVTKTLFVNPIAAQEEGVVKGMSRGDVQHHATLCIAAYGFLISERETIPPSGVRSGGLFQTPRLSKDHRPRGSAAAHRTSHPKLYRNHATTIERRACKPTLAMSLLRPTDEERQVTKFVAQ